MWRSQSIRIVAVVVVGTSMAAAAGARAQTMDSTRARAAGEVEPAPEAPTDSANSQNSDLRFSSRDDSLDWARAKDIADRSSGFRILVSLEARRLWVLSDQDTLLVAPVAVAKGTTLDFDGRSWTFKTPRGVRTVLDKEANPIWQPPDWVYAEAAEEHGLKLRHMPADGAVTLDDGRKLVVQDGVAGIIDSTGEFAVLPTDLHIVFDSTVFIPPIGTLNRRVEGELGKYRLNLGDGYLLHGTPDKASIGTASTHGCIRLGDDDIEWLYDNIPVGTRVYIY